MVRFLEGQTPAKLSTSRDAQLAHFNPFLSSEIKKFVVSQKTCHVGLRNNMFIWASDAEGGQIMFLSLSVSLLNAAEFCGGGWEFIRLKLPFKIREESHQYAFRVNNDQVIANVRGITEGSNDQGFPK